MYKSKLQEVCHKNQWGQPKYTCKKDGPDHYPQFKASVVVNRMTFDSPTFCKSYKAAQNEAAKLACIHFTSVLSPLINVGKKLISRGQVSEDMNETLRYIQMLQLLKLARNLNIDVPSTEPNAKGSNVEEQYQSTVGHSNISNAMDALQFQYKRKLQGYAQGRNLDSPLYSSIREGPPHALCFKGTVTVDGDSFESPSYYKTLKEAENYAAKVALKSLSLDGFQENDTRLYKNLLQQLAQNEGFILPTYKTISTGESHKPTFFSTVEVEEEIFHGKGAPTKKQAELNAAVVAYTAFMERKLSRSGSFTSPSFPEDEAHLEFSPIRDSLTIVDPQQSLKHGGPLVSPITAGCEEKARENETKQFLVSVQASSQDFISSPAIQDMDKTTGTKNSSSSLELLLSSSNRGQSSSATMTPPDLSTLSITDSNWRRTMGMSYLLCDRVRVYTSIPDMAFPKGTVVLPIGDQKWVAVSLEFPNEKDN